MLVGIICYSFAVGSLTTLISNMDKKDVKLNEKMGFLRELKDKFKLSYSFYLNVRKSILYDHNRSTIDKYQFLNSLPPNLRLELSYIMHQSSLESFPFFKNKSKQLIATLGPMLKPLRVLKDDYIYMEGDPIDEIYFLSSGSASMVIPELDDLIFLAIDSGYLFGETDLLVEGEGSGRRKFTVKASKDCELYILKINDLYKLSTDFNEVFNELLENGEIRLNKIEELRKKAFQANNQDVNKQSSKAVVGVKKAKLSPFYTNIKFIDEEENILKSRNTPDKNGMIFKSESPSIKRISQKLNKITQNSRCMNMDFIKAFRNSDHTDYNDRNQSADTKIKKSQQYKDHVSECISSISKTTINDNSIPFTSS
jgi:CRP-like cAMP-binding protein